MCWPNPNPQEWPPFGCAKEDERFQCWRPCKDCQGCVRVLKAQRADPSWNPLEQTLTCEECAAINNAVPDWAR
jgi:hypothetical protein